MDYKISVITPVLNGERFIESCMRNVIEQDCPLVEHLIIDGGSMDGTVEMIRKYAGMHAHIRYVSEPDHGQSDALNKGIAMAAGDVIGSLNADDYYEPGVLNRITEIFRTLSGPCIVVGNCNVWRSDGTLWFVSAPRKLGWKSILAGRFRESFPMNSSAYFYHKSVHDVVGLYDITDHYSLDVDFMIRVLRDANAIYYDEIWGNYRYLPGTKTYCDDITGENGRRLKKLTRSYMKNLHFADKVTVMWERSVIKFFDRMRGWHVLSL